MDLVKGGQILYRDADEQTIWRLLGQAEEAEIIVTCIGGNGFLFGRGNQQISPRIIRAVRKEHIRIAVTRQKLAHLGGKPMLVDTGDGRVPEGILQDPVQWPGVGPVPGRSELINI